MDKTARMKELIAILNEASRAYYAQDREIMSNYEYDKLYDELVSLEEETGTVMAGSPTVSVGYEAVDELPKERHESPMLSLGKTKSREDLRDWLGEQKGLLSWKLDGLTIVLTYRDGQLFKAVTRGNGEIGEVITGNARVFVNLPLSIPFKGELVLRGEAVITYEDFRKINEQIEDADARYKNPRNLCSGSVRQLNNEITAQRNVRFFAFALVKADDVDFQNSRKEQFLFLQKLGFEVVEFKEVDSDTILSAVEEFENKVAGYSVPSDGLVLIYDDIAYGLSLGRTAKFPRDSIAFKWADETAETTLREIEWSASRTGIGDRITVYKANMIIPQIAENLTGSDTLPIPDACPVCGGATKIEQVNDVQSLYCTNPDCDAKKLKAFTLFVSRDAMNIDGLSEATLEKFLGRGYLHTFADLFHLGKYEEEIIEMEGFGEKSFRNLMESLERARKTTLPRVIYGLGIANIGLANAKMLCREYHDDLERMMEADVEELSLIDGIGGVIAGTFHDYWQSETNRENMKKLLKELEIEQIEVDESALTLQGKVFVVTGSLEHFDGRSALKELIESRGGKVTGSVTGKTTCLINNDIASNSSKNKKAKELEVPIVTEEDFMRQYLDMEV